MTEFTSQFLQKLYFNLPPLVPEKTQVQLEQELENLEKEPKTVEDIENIIIRYSKGLWPQIQAFEELVQSYLQEKGETLLLRKASYGLKSAYEKYRKGGGSWTGIYRGETASAFTTEERTELHELLVDIICDVRSFARQAALVADRAVYEKRIAYYRDRYQTIERELQRLEILAKEEENVNLAREIRQHVRDFELGIASLGPALDFQAVCQAHEHFVGRKKELVARGRLHLL